MILQKEKSPLTCFEFEVNRAQRIKIDSTWRRHRSIVSPVNFHCLSPITPAICNLIIVINQRHKFVLVFERLRKINRRENDEACREDKVGRDSVTDKRVNVILKMTAQAAISLSSRSRERNCTMGQKRRRNDTKNHYSW